MFVISEPTFSESLNLKKHTFPKLKRTRQRNRLETVKQITAFEEEASKECVYQVEILCRNVGAVRRILLK
jgi:hypothetical protein